MTAENVPDGTVLCIIPGPSHLYREHAAGDLWCFRCRRHLPHTDQLLGDPPDVLTYYEPQWVRRCSSCREDHTAFPGTRW